MELVITKQLIRLIENDHLHSGKFKICFGQKLHQSTRCGNNDVRIQTQSFKLSCVIMTSQNQTVSKINFM